jgi:hypothetical protein
LPAHEGVKGHHTKNGIVLPKPICKRSVGDKSKGECVGLGWSSKVEYLPGMHEALGPIPNTAKKRKEGRKGERRGEEKKKKRN